MSGRVGAVACGGALFPELDGALEDHPRHLPLLHRPALRAHTDTRTRTRTRTRTHARTHARTYDNKQARTQHARATHEYQCARGVLKIRKIEVSHFATHE